MTGSDSNIVVADYFIPRETDNADFDILETDPGMQSGCVFPPQTKTTPEEPGLALIYRDIAPP